MTAAATTTVLTIAVENSVTRFGLFSICRDVPAGATEPELTGVCELITIHPATPDEARVQMRHACSLLGAELPRANQPGADGATWDGAILSCVVPELTDVWRAALTNVSAARPLVVGPGLKTGLPLDVDDPSEVGSDRIANVVAARARYGSPAVVVDLGTATHIEAIDARGAFVGGVIAAGVALGARSLSEAAARLPMIELRTPRRVLGRNTREAMQAGIVLGEVARIDGLLDAVMAELAGEAPVVITGSQASAIAPLLRYKAHLDDTLTLRGLAILWARNAR